MSWAIYLEVPEVTMVNRCLGRSFPDDRPEIIHRRIELFYEYTVPILEYYDRRGCLLKINGDRTPEEVQRNLTNLIHSS